MSSNKECSRRTFLKIAATVGALAAVEGINYYGKDFGLSVDGKDIKPLPSSVSYPSPYPSDNMVPLELRPTPEPPLNM